MPIVTIVVVVVVVVVFSQPKTLSSFPCFGIEKPLAKINQRRNGFNSSARIDV